MKSAFCRFALAAFAVLLFFAAGPAAGKEKDMTIETVAVMPFGAWLGENATIDVTEYVTAGLAARGFASVPAADLEGFLVAKGIRRPHFLDRPAIRAMGMDLRTDALVMGYADILAYEGSAQVSLNAQMVDCHEAAVVWANAVAVTGEDFVTVLGLGRISSVEELLRIAVDRLLDRLPRTVSLESTAVSPYEIIRASFSPGTLRSGEKAALSVEVKEMAGGIRNIKAFLMEEEIRLNSDDGRWYTGLVAAPKLEGVYPLKLYVTDDQNRVFTVSDAARLTVHNTPPEVFMTLRQKAFSPNGDGIQDQMVLAPEARSASGLRRWRVEFATQEGVVVRAEEGSERLPEAFAWRGHDNRDNLAPDGIYVCRLEVEDQAGNLSSTAGQPVVVDTAAPEAKLVLAPGGGALEATVVDLSGVKVWKLTLYGESGAEVRIEGAGDVPATLACPDGTWDAWEMEAEDAAGNRLKTERKPLVRKKSEIQVQDLMEEEKRKAWDAKF